MTDLTEKEDKIISVLYSAGKALSIAEIAEHAKMSQPTVNLYLTLLENKKYVMGKRIGKYVYWRLLENESDFEPVERLKKPFLRNITRVKKHTRRR